MLLYISYEHEGDLDKASSTHGKGVYLVNKMPFADGFTAPCRVQMWLIGL